MTENEISYLIRGSIYEVYNYFGPGLLESIYQEALCVALRRKNVSVKKEVGIPVMFDDQHLDIGFRIDILIEDKVIIEVKSVKALEAVHHKQLQSYVKLTGVKLGILVNFNTADINKSIVRIANNL
jgi:GxxExxY protein